MATLTLRTRAIVADSWLRIERRVDGAPAAIPTDGDLLVPLELWLAERAALQWPPGRIGVWLDADADPELLAEDLPRFRMIAVHVSQFADGRVYSLARLLRERYGYWGELRACGDVRRDQLFYLARCGFDSFELASDQDPTEALTGLDDFRTVYQAAHDRGIALSRRDAALAFAGAML